MPRPGLPPTPGSSTDIKGQDGTHKLASLQLAFELPPPALHDASRISPVDLKPSPAGRNITPPTSSAQSPSTINSSLSSYPMQAAETVKSRRRSSAANTAKDASNASTFALPPPPTRSRKIIQMKPPQEEPAGSSNATSAAASTSARGKGTAGKSAGTKADPSAAVAGGKAAAAAAAGNSGSGAATGGKKKQPSATSAAGRKIARKTAHSLIERRRRSKMNEEFALLKSMIPACTGEMHKLAILQASIEYLRYLEDCVGKLKAQHEDDQSRNGGSSSTGAQLPSIHEFHPTFRDDTADVDMTDSEAVSPTFTATPDHATRHPSVSPALYAQDAAAARGRQHSYSSVSTDHHRHYSYSASAGTSPAFGPQIGSGGFGAASGPHGGGGGPSSNAGSALTSPALNPQSDLDQEATAALLMLNSDRRGYSNASAAAAAAAAAANNGRGLSVRDLLTT